MEFEEGIFFKTIYNYKKTAIFEQNIAVWLRHKHTTIADKSEMNKKRYIKNMAFSKKSEKYFQFSIVYTKLNTVFGFCKMLTVFETNNCGHKKRTSAYTIFAVRNSAVSVVEAWKSRRNIQRKINCLNDCLHFVIANTIKQTKYLLICLLSQN